MILALLIACTPPPVHDTLPLARAVAEKGVARWEAESLAQDWIPTVWTYGLHRLHEADPEGPWQAYYRAWIEGWSGSGIHSSDSLSPALLAAVLRTEDPSADVGDALAAADAYLATAPRTDEGAIEHWSGESPFQVPDQVWVDSLFMFGPYLLHRELHGEPAASDTLVAQYQLFTDLCRDTDLYVHAYDDPTDSRIGVHWARGNAWVLIAAAELIATGDRRLEEPFVAHAEALAALQAEDGLWRTVLDVPDDPANYTETSGSALIAYGLARGVRAGVLPEDETLPVIGAAVRGIRDRIDEDLVVEGTSYGTNPGDYDHYVAVGQADDLMLGVGAVVMLLAEAHGLEDR